MKKVSSNLAVQIVSLVLWAFALSGLQVNPEVTGTDLVNHITTQNWPLLFIVVINIGNSVYSWIRTWKTDKPNFLLFLKSPNWWISFCNILFAALAFKGITIPAEASEHIVKLVFDQQWWALLGYLIPNVLGPIIRALTTKKTPAVG